MLYVFFIFGGFWFWALCLVEIFLLFTFVEQEEGWWCFFTIAGFLLLTHLFGDINIFPYIRDNPWQILKYIGLYFLSTSFEEMNFKTLREKE